MAKKRIIIRVKKDRKPRTPHRPTLVHKDRKKYTRKGRTASRRRKALLREWQQSIEG